MSPAPSSTPLNERSLKLDAPLRVRVVPAVVVTATGLRAVMLFTVRLAVSTVLSNVTGPAPGGITTSLLAVGSTPPDQFAALDQRPAPPIQVAVLVAAAVRTTV